MPTTILALATTVLVAVPVIRYARHRRATLAIERQRDEVRREQAAANTWKSEIRDNRIVGGCGVTLRGQNEA